MNVQVRSHDIPNHVKQNTGEYLGSYKIFVSMNKDKEIYGEIKMENLAWNAVLFFSVDVAH